MSWKNRVRQSIVFISPNGDRFEAFWRDNQRSITKKLGIFELPDKTGARVQDLDVGAFRHPITIYFEGRDHDLDSEKFLQACKQKGLWSIGHPVKKTFEAQLISATESIAPVGDGNISQIDTEWIEPDFKIATLTTPELAQDILRIIAEIEDESINQILFMCKQYKAIQTQSIRIEVRKITGLFEKNILSLYQKNGNIYSDIKAIQSGIESIILEDTIDLEVLSGQIQAMIKAPVKVSGSKERAVFFTDIVSAILSMTEIVEATDRNRNRIAIRELFLVSVLSTLCEITITSDLFIRKESIELIDMLTNQLGNITNYLDGFQTLFDDVLIDYQYFSQSSSYSSTLVVIGMTLQYLLLKSFDLAAEKRFFLSMDEPPIFTTIKEYGSLGENDSLFDFFISTNELKGNDIMLMKSGREVVVYV